MTEGARTGPGQWRLPLVPFLQVVQRHRKLILWMTIGSAVVAAVAGLVSPATYESDLTILPPEAGGGIDLLGGNLQSSLAKLQIGFATQTTSDLFADMLKSRSVLRHAIDKVGLIDYYDLPKQDSLRAYSYAYGILDQDVSVRTNNDGLILLNARARTGYLPGAGSKRKAREMAAALGNALGEGLELVNREKNTSQARQARIYLERQLALTSDRLDSAGAALARFQRSHLAINLDDQMRVGIETAGKLEGELLARQVSLAVALQSMLPDNPEVQRLQSEARALRRQIQGMQRGGTGDSLQWGLEELPEISRRYALLLREVKVQENVYEILTEQLHYARIKETETLPVVQVLDEASMPIFKKKPVVRIVTLLGAGLGLVAGIFLAHAREWWEQYPYRREDGAFLRSFWRR